VAAWLLASFAGCAEGVSAYPIGQDEPSLSAWPPLFVPDASTGTGGATPMMEEVPLAGTVSVMGDPCTRNDMLACDCPDSDAQGQRVCVANAASPSGGFFSDCLACPPPAPPDPCTNSMQDGAETAIDCGGGECGACADGLSCAVASDCMSGACEAQLCVAMSAGTGGASGDVASGGVGGTSASGGTGGMSGGAGGTDASGGTGGSGGMEEPERCDCDGLLRCCRRDNTCGVRVLLACL
jgi:hypothetical protein